MANQQLVDLVAEIVTRQVEYDRLKFDELIPHPLGPPSTPEELRQLALRFGSDLPADYVDFLALYNGWEDFDGDGKILATSDHDRTWVADRIEEWCSIWDPDAVNPFKSGALAVMLGASKNSFLLLEARDTASGESTMFVMYDYMEPEETFASFTSYLQRRLEILDALISREIKGQDDNE